MNLYPILKSISVVKTLSQYMSAAKSLLKDSIKKQIRKAVLHSAEHLNLVHQNR